jgi:hypothetical protein
MSVTQKGNVMLNFECLLIIIHQFTFQHIYQLWQTISRE